MNSILLILVIPIHIFICIFIGNYVRNNLLGYPEPEDFSFSEGILNYFVGAVVLGAIYLIATSLGILS
ncbi:hypothetical protein WJR50_32980 [Catalinimonas sp. 4WD22]